MAVGCDAGSSVSDVFVGRALEADALEARASEDFAGLARAASASASSSGPPSAARVLPLPVGVTSRPDSPRRQRRQASRWKGADVPDPYYGGVEGFEQVLDMVEEAAERWLDILEAELDPGAFRLQQPG